MVAGVHHVEIVVEDLEKSVRFQRDVMGLELIPNTQRRLWILRPYAYLVRKPG